MDPVTIILERRAQPGANAEFETWLKELIALARRSPAIEGSSELTASVGDDFILLRVVR